jgi:hypothetical protein
MSLLKSLTDPRRLILKPYVANQDSQPVPSEEVSPCRPRDGTMRWIGQPAEP